MAHWDHQGPQCDTIDGACSQPVHGGVIVVVEVQVTAKNSPHPSKRRRYTLVFVCMTVRTNFCFYLMFKVSHTLFRKYFRKQKYED